MSRSCVLNLWLAFSSAALWHLVHRRSGGEPRLWWKYTGAESLDGKESVMKPDVIFYLFYLFFIHRGHGTSLTWKEELMLFFKWVLEDSRPDRFEMCWGTWSVTGASSWLRSWRKRAKHDVSAESWLCNNFPCDVWGHEKRKEILHLLQDHRSRAEWCCYLPCRPRS